MKGEQIPLPVQLRGSASFDTFYAGPNQPAVDALRNAATTGICLYGAAGTGKSHLLQAAARDAQIHGRQAGYLPLSDLAGNGADALDGLTGFDFVALDDLDVVSADAQWNQALIRLLDRLRTDGARWCVTASAAPDRLTALLSDLRTRLSSVPCFGLRPLADDDRQRWLRSAMQQRGLELPDEAARWLLHHRPRDPGSLLAAIETLDRASLRDKRRLTLAFVQKTLGAG